MLQHMFTAATCEQPRTCTVCALTEGTAQGHDLKEWNITKAPTCSEKGIQEAICVKCSKSVMQEIDCIEHVAGEWEIKTYPSAYSDGVKVQKCSVCGSIVKEEKYSLTMGQRNALREAESYLSVMAFSRKGLIEQLKYEGYSVEDATFAVDNVKVDWNEQCYKDAQSYLDFMAFSKEGLKRQLEYEGYTNEQIEYAIKKIGY